MYTRNKKGVTDITGRNTRNKNSEENSIWQARRGRWLQIQDWWDTSTKRNVRTLFAKTNYEKTLQKNSWKTKLGLDNTTLLVLIINQY